MNPQRLVAAVAAVAIGFGVTLAGVIAADDTGAPEPSQVQADPDPSSDENDVGDAAEQEAEPAPEPAPAEAEPAPVDDADTESPPVGAPSQEAPSQPSEQSTQETRVPIDDSIDSGSECGSAYVVIGTNGQVIVLVDDDVVIGTDGRLFLPGADVSLDQLANIAQIQVRVAAQISEDGDDVFIDCDDETLIPERNADEFIGEIERLLQIDVGVPDPIEGDGERESGGDASPDFPCGDSLLRALERTYIEQFGLELEPDSDDDVIVLVSLAQRVAALSFEFDNAENDLEFWIDELQGPFSGFRVDDEVADACALLAENLAPTLSTRAGFFCAIGQLASDERLLQFLNGLVPLPADCDYPEPDTGGFGSIRGENDQGEN